MLFEAINNKGETVFFTEEEFCIPNKRQINIMFEAGYKFKIDGKIATKKKLNEIIK